VTFIDYPARGRLEGDVVNADGIAIVGTFHRRLAQAQGDRPLWRLAPEVEDRLSALADDLRDARPAQGGEQLAVEDEAPLEIPDDEVDVVERRAQGEMATMRSIGTRARSATTGSTFT
jgi:hypothetical protein